MKAALRPDGSTCFDVNRRGLFHRVADSSPLNARCLYRLATWSALVRGSPLWSGLDPNFSQLQSLIAEAGRQSPSELRQFAIGQLLTALLIGPPMHALTTIGEEVGWRDFLLRRLIVAGFSQWAALLMSGAVWGLWHIPLILLGLEYTNSPFLGIPAFVVYAALVGIILGWLQLASGRVWVPAVAHGSINAFQRALLVFITGYDGLISGGLGSVVRWLPLTAFIIWLARSRRLPQRSGDLPENDQLYRSPGQKLPPDRNNPITNLLVRPSPA
jgi:membrane protease YdiL (CAAX protease family)